MYPKPQSRSEKEKLRGHRTPKSPKQPCVAHSLLRSKEAQLYYIPVLSF